MGESSAHQTSPTMPFMIRHPESGGLVVHYDGLGDKLLSTRYCNPGQEPDSPDDWCRFVYQKKKKFLKCVANGDVMHWDGLGDKLISGRYGNPDTPVPEPDLWCCFDFNEDNGHIYAIGDPGMTEPNVWHLDGLGDSLVSTRWGNPGSDVPEPDAWCEWEICAEAFKLKNKVTGCWLHYDGLGDKILSSRYCNEGCEPDSPDDWCLFTYEERTKRIRCVANGDCMHWDGLGDKLISGRYGNPGTPVEEPDLWCRFEYDEDERLIYALGDPGMTEPHVWHLDQAGDKLVSTRYCNPGQEPDSPDDWCKFKIKSAH